MPSTIVCPPWCDRCLAESEENKLLGELAHSANKSIQELLREVRLGHHPTLREKANQHAKQRAEEQNKRLQALEERLMQRNEELAQDAAQDLMDGEESDTVAQKIIEDELRQELEQQVSNLRSQNSGMMGQDIEAVINDMIQKGYLDVKDGRLKVTPQGARKLAKEALRRILEKLQCRELGPHAMAEMGYGSQRSSKTRNLELGDDYSLTHIEKTLLNAVSRAFQEGSVLALKAEDFEIHELVHQTKVTSGILVDESGSMQGDKLHAAVDTSLALSQLIRQEPKDVLKVFLFSDHTKQVKDWEIFNTTFSGGTTDIRTVLRDFRQSVYMQQGDKQAYLITDTEPNTQDGKYVGFETASAGILEEAWEYRKAGITLNIIMLSQSPHLKALSSELGKRSLGRVFFTTPQDLGGIVIEDYLKSKRKTFRSIK